jgi:hypothetical protein
MKGKTKTCFAGDRKYAVNIRFHATNLNDTRHTLVTFPDFNIANIEEKTLL